MYVSTSSDVYAIYGQTEETSTTKQFADFGSVEFMQLLMAQLQHQNPLEPMDDSEMMNQIASLNSLDELRAMKTIMSESAVASQATYGASLIGKTVKVGLDDGTILEGVVSGTSVEGGRMFLEIDGQKAPLGNVLEIRQE